jgi:acetyl-CoA acetyltransferase
MDTLNIRGRTAIAGLGMTAMGKVFTHRNALGFAIESIELALADAGMDRSELDGLLINPGGLWRNILSPTYEVQDAMGLELRLSSGMHAGGATAGTMIATAAQAVACGTANAVACVYADMPLKPVAEGPRKSTRASQAYGRSDNNGDPYGLPGMLGAAYGQFGSNYLYALVARRHVDLFGTTNDHLGAIAVAQRRWANLNPAAQFRDQPLTIEDYHASPWVAEPLHLYDCCIVSNGAICAIVTSAERARDLRKPPVYILGVGYSHARRPTLETMETGCPKARDTAFKMAGVELKDIQFAELYDCYTITVLMTLEGYGFCARGEGGPFVAGGKTGPGGSFPVNTGGGELSAYYMWGMTPISEAIIQIRGEGGARQLPKHDLCLASAQTRTLATHAAMVLSSSV